MILNKTGVNYIGYFNEMCGLTEASRSNVNALEQVGIKVNIVSYRFNHERDLYLSDKISDPKKYSINIFHINLGTIKSYINDIGKQQFKDSYNIAFWAWEFVEMPKDLLPYFKLFDEIWTPSDFCVKIFSKFSFGSVISIPHPINFNISGLNRSDLKLPENDFIFLTIFDSHSTLLRKNPYAVIKAFKKEFQSSSNVKLIVKSISLEQFPEESKKINDLIDNSSNITLIDERIERREFTGLIEQSDCLVSLHRSEGFGLTMAEAMFFGKPVIATGYSGNLEFMNINNSYLTKYELTPLIEEKGMLKKGYIAADADIEHATILMKNVYENQIEATKIGEIAQNEIKEKFSLESIGNLMKNRLEYISKNQPKKRFSFLKKCTL